MSGAALVVSLLTALLVVAAGAAPSTAAQGSSPRTLEGTRT
jgi:hypothetical protein